MNLYEPILTLVKVYTTSGYEYYLHAITYFEGTNYISDGFDPIPSKPTSNGCQEILLKVSTSQEEINLNIISPICHTVPLGKIEFSPECPLLKVTVMYKERIVSCTFIHELNTKEDGKPTIPAF